jgi:hypothetical protein
MFGKDSQLSPLKSRKQLLLAESESNRIQLSGEWETMAHEACDVARRAKTMAAWASSAALLVAGITALRHGPPAPVAVKSSWLEKILTGVRLASTLWFAVRARGAKEEHT